MAPVVTAAVGGKALTHPAWCDVERCPMRYLAAGMAHQSRELTVDVGGRRAVTVVLIQYPGGLPKVAVSPQEWPPDVAGQVARAVVEVAGWASTARP